MNDDFCECAQALDVHSNICGVCKKTVRASMTKTIKKKWFGRIVFTREGIVTERIFKSEELAAAYVYGAADMKQQYDSVDGEEGCLEDIVAIYSDVEAEEL